jgi:hypothetical protein
MRGARRAVAGPGLPGQFFTQWFDTAYPSGGGKNRPMITGPGLAGPDFYSAPGVCP